ncbi:MAG: 4Fe-4S dicluster domain-containing protein [Longimicrobiales bacterium]
MSSPDDTIGGRNRRQFLKEAGAAALGVGWALPVLSGCETAEAVQAHDATGPAASQAEHQLAMVVDVEKCSRDPVRRAVVEACHRTHNVPRISDPDDEIKWIWDAEYRHVFPDQVHDRMPPEVQEAPVLVLCNHCESPPCVRVCPTQATWKRESDGIVMMDMHRCIGCRYCMAACPYGSRSFNWRDPRPFIDTDADGELLSDYPTRTRGVVEKCNFCADRLRDGLEPACVEAAAQVEGGEGALVFGDLSDPDSEVSHVLRERATLVRRPGLGTGPKVYYIV